MAAPKGNEFWKLRLKHGRDTIIKTPEELWQNYEEYAEWCNNNPLQSIDYVGKDAMPVVRYHPFAQTKDSFSIACGYYSWGNLITTLNNKKGFSEIITRIEKHIFQQKYTNAAAGLLKENIIARETGLTERQEVNQNIKLGIEKESYD